MGSGSYEWKGDKERGQGIIVREVVGWKGAMKQEGS